jgi:predicted nucleic acid-binding Zn ribbon protein
MNHSIRQRVLYEWRGLPAAFDRPDRAKSVAELLPLAFKKMGLAERLNESEVMQAWKDIVGEFIAAHSSPQCFAKGVLYVQVVQPTLHYELDREWKPEILRKLKARFGVRRIREVKFRV